MAVPGGRLEVGVHLGGRVVLEALEDLAEDLDGALRVQPHLAHLGLASERDDEEHLIGDLGDVQVERVPLVEEQRELVLIEDPGQLLRSGERARCEGGQGEGLRVVVVGRRGDGLSGRADEREEARARDLLELAEEVVTAVELTIVDDESLATSHARTSR